MALAAAAVVHGGSGLVGPYVGGWQINAPTGFSRLGGIFLTSKFDFVKLFFFSCPSLTTRSQDATRERVGEGFRNFD